MYFFAILVGIIIVLEERLPHIGITDFPLCDSLRVFGVYSLFRPRVIPLDKATGKPMPKA